MRMLKKVSNEIKLKTTGDYHDLYIKTDNLLLADFSKQFRKKSLQN